MSAKSKMEPQNAKYMRIERQPGSLDVHPNIDALILSYEVDVQVLGFNEHPLYGEKNKFKKIIELPMLNSRIDCHALSKEVVNQSELLHYSRIAEVEQLIYYLKKRRLYGETKTEFEKIEEYSSIHVANYNSLSDYIDLLYEGTAEKIRGAHLIQFLARDPENLEALSTNETLISALGRVLREDWKRSLSLSTHLVFTFFCFSMYSSFHFIILKCKVGSICMDIVEFELRRYEKWKSELEGMDVSLDIPIIKNAYHNSTSMMEIPRSRIPEPVRPKSGNFSDSPVKTSLDESKINLNDTLKDELSISVESLNDKRLTPEQKLKWLKGLVKKQDHLLRVAFYLLLNISEDETVEEKMSKKNIVGLLVKALERNNDDLLILVITFLKKLSIMQYNKEIMIDQNLTDKLQKMFKSRSADLIHLTLKLLYNLSFDNKHRSRIIKTGFIPKVINFMGDDRHQEVVLKFLYHLSYDKDSINQFVNCIGLIVDMLLLNVSNDVDKVMIALCINLTVYPEISYQIAKENRLQSLITRALSSETNMLLKIIYNISNNRSISTSFIEFVGDIAKVTVESNDPGLVTECMGILGNLYVPDLDWAGVFIHFDITKWINNIISITHSNPELILQAIILIGTAGTDENCAKLFCESGIMTTLIHLLKTYQEDDEIVLQIMYVFYVSLWYEKNREYIITKTDIPAYLIDLLQDNNKNILKLCNMCLNIIVDYDTTWANRIRIEKFRHHNAQWLQMVDLQQLEPDDDDNEDEEELPPYLNTKYLSKAVVCPVSSINKMKEMDLEEIRNVDYDFLSRHKDDIGILTNYDMEDI